MLKTAKLLLLIAWIAPALAEDATPKTSVAAAPVKVDFPRAGSFIQFFNVGSGDESHIEIYALSHNVGGYENLYIGRLDQEGGPPIIESVFLDNADSDPQKELFVLGRWEIRHPGLNTAGNYYQVQIYDDNPNQDGTRFRRLIPLEKKIEPGLDGTREGEKVVYRYKDAASIRKLLRKLGY